MKGGWITVPRRFFESASWSEKREISRAEAELDLYQSAQWEDGERTIKGKYFRLRRGELVASLNYLALKWDWHRSKVNRFLQNLEQRRTENRTSSETPDGFCIERRTEQGETIITICNYDAWTLNENSGRNTSRGASETAAETPGDNATNGIRNKEKEGKNSKKERSEAAAASLAEKLISAHPRPAFTRPALEAAADCLARHEGKFSADQIIEATRAYSAAVATWTDDERVQFITPPEKFFERDDWRKHPDLWRSRRGAKGRNAGARSGQMSEEEVRMALGGRGFDEHGNDRII